jgi:ABC-type sulfate transport system permease component
VELMSTAIRAFAAWWYDHREVPREQVVDAIMDVAAVAPATSRPRPEPP